MSGERAPWRHQAEVACLKSGAVKIGAGVVQIEPIEGPGMCGADFPLKVAALGESSPAISYADDLRPPGSIPATSAQMPRWPINEPRYAPPAPVGSGARTIGRRPRDMRWVPGPPPAQQPRYATPDQPMSLSPPGGEPGVTPSAAPLPDDIPDDAVLPRGRAPRGIYATARVRRADLSAAATTRGASTRSFPWAFIWAFTWTITWRTWTIPWTFPCAANDGCCRVRRH